MTTRKVAGTIVLCKGKILLLKRHEKDSFPGYYGLPGGGVKNGEEFKHAALRELREETGLELNDLEKFMNIKDKRIDYHAFMTKLDKKPEIALSHEHSDYLWIAPKAALKMKNLVYKQNFDKLLLKLLG